MAELFTKESTLEEILNNERVSKKIEYIFNPIYLENIRPFYYKIKLKIIEHLVKTPWGKPFPVDGFLRCANFLVQRRDAGEKISIPIWKGLPDEEMASMEKVVLVPFTKKGRNNAPCVILCPGGAYNRVAFHNEGIPVAEYLNGMGYQTFILNYRVYPDIYPLALQDLFRAIRFVRANSQKLGVDPNRITVMGFSAGGHLCAMSGILYDQIEDPTHRYDAVSARPNQICLCYPVISFVTDGHLGCIRNLLGNAVTIEHLRAMSAELRIPCDYPKTFIWACEDDPVVSVHHSEMMDKALNDQHIEHKMHLFPTGGHGIGPAEKTSAQGWLEEAMAYLDQH